MKVICIGNVAYDITIPVNGFPKENTKNRVSKRIECGGGPASNAAYLLGKWGVDVSFAGVLGGDEFGKRIIEEFKEVNVNIDFLQIDQNSKTTASFIIANKENGSRTVLSYREPKMELDDIQLDFAPDIILIDGQEEIVSKKIIAKYPDAISVIDAGRATEKVINLCKQVDYVVCSKRFAEEVSGLKVDYRVPQTLVSIYHHLKKQFPGEVVITLEDKGSLYRKENEIRVMPSLKVKAVDSTGAGDIFHGAFIYGLTKKWDLEKICKLSNIAGALSVTRLGGRKSVFCKEEIKAIWDEFA